LQEWLEDWDAEAPEQQHRHVSHLYAVYPSHQLNVRDTPAMIRAAEVSLDRRGDRSTGWATAWRLCLWARMGRAERAHSILLGLLGPERTVSQPVRCAPAVPDRRQFRRRGRDPRNAGAELGRRAHPAARTAGRMADRLGLGVRARGGLVVDLYWSSGKVRSLLVRGPPGTRFGLRVGESLAQVTLDARGRYSLTN
jgi:alpha-L-fucosidase 2